MKSRFISGEWKTLALGLGLYGAWGALIFFHDLLPGAAFSLLGAFVIALHGSFQHETIHGHPTGIRGFDTALGSLALNPLLPYEIYRSTHLAHHGTQVFSHPLDDPESFHVSAKRWENSAPWMRAVLWVNQTLLGRMLVGPFLYLGSLGSMIVKHPSRELLRAWALHAVFVAPVMAWLVFCGLSVGTYLALVVYPGFALTLVRSYIEHRPASTPAAGCVLIEAEKPLHFVFLGNNLHLVHHLYPKKPWYELSRLYRENKQRWLSLNGGFSFRGYREVFARYAFKPRDAPFLRDRCDEG